MQALAGELSIALATAAGVVTRVEIVSSRPQVADRLLAGRPAAAAVALVPQLFTVCGRAQALAARLAWQAAQGLPAQDDECAALAPGVETEIAQEYLWRALLDWPQALGAAPADVALLAALRRAFAADPGGRLPATRAALRDAVAQAVLAADPAAWHAQLAPAELCDWLRRAATPAARLLAAVAQAGARAGAPADESAVPLLPAFDDPAVLRPVAEALAADTAAAAFARAPQYAGRPAETGAVARLRQHPLVAALLATDGRSTFTRLAARLLELARIAAGIAAPAPPCGRLTLEGSGRGAGWVETARGLLLHLIELAPDGERIARYRILAPTEWNFHPRGALAAGLLGSAAADAAALRLRADALVQALDPCVAYALRVDEEAAHA